jgi:arylsulfatase A-like enzyme
VALGAWLALPLVVAKAVHWGRPGEYGWTAWLRDVAVSSHQDVAFCAAFALLSAVVLLLVRRSPRAERWAGVLLVAAGSLFVLYAVVSVQIFAFLRSPLTYALLYLAGDPGSMRSSIGSFVSPALVAACVLMPAAYATLIRRTPRAVGARGTAAGALFLAAAVAWTLWGAAAARGRWSDRSDVLIAQSPHLAILASTAAVVRGEGVPVIADSFPPGDLDDFRPGPPGRSTAPRAGTVRNVLVVVMESTGARYLGLYGGRYPTTPHLSAEAAHAVVYDRAYANVGFTANALVALTLSMHPYMTWREYTQEHPDFPGRTAAEVLKAQGYRTSFLTSGFIEYVNQDAFLRSRGYDEVRGFEQLDAGEAVNSWGGSDAVLVDRTLEWIDRDPARPFYATVWTQQAHHPYDSVPGHEAVDFFGDGPLPPDDYDLGRYLNAVASVDHQLGRLFAGLRARGLDDETLVVVTADHGEAFGDPHPTWGHGFRLYDEGVRVPLMLWSPVLFPEGRRDDTVASHVDVAPTVLDLLGVAAPAEWEGRSVFAERRPPRAYFYAANDHYLLGVREGDLKYVYDASRGRDQLFDLARDPDELQNLAAERPEVCRRLRQRLAAWKHHAAQRLTEARALAERRSRQADAAPIGGAP